MTNDTLSALVQVIGWRRTGDMPLFEPMMSFLSFLLFNSPSDASMRQWTRESFDKITFCRLVGTKPLSELMLPLGTISGNLESKLHVRVIHKEMSSANWRPFCLVLRILTHILFTTLALAWSFVQAPVTRSQRPQENKAHGSMFNPLRRSDAYMRQ